MTVEAKKIHLQYAGYRVFERGNLIIIANKRDIPRGFRSVNAAHKYVFGY